MPLFDKLEAAERDAARPLAARMRPLALEEYVGQQHILAPGKLLRRIIEADRLSSIVLFGPPGTGKTSLAELLAVHSRRKFVTLNAASASVKDLRDALDGARQRLETGGTKTILFIDELHHFNKTQQSVLLPDLEQGIVAMVAATTANPFIALIAPLTSRSQIFELQPLSIDDVKGLLDRALADSDRGLGKLRITLDDEARTFLATICDGDARRALGSLEIAALSLPPGQKQVTLAIAEESVQRKAIRYDRAGDDHYDAASAFIKSIRGSDPDAAIYWLARMLEAGEDPRFIARRLVISASEDIGNADPHGLVLAVSASRAVEFVGMPEARICLAQATTYLAMAPKSNASYVAIEEAGTDVREGRLLPVPMHLRGTSYAGAKRLDRGAGYIYPHDREGGWAAQDYLGVEKEYYRPTDRGEEAAMQTRLADLRTRRHPPATEP